MWVQPSSALWHWIIRILYIKHIRNRWLAKKTSTEMLKPLEWWNKARTRPKMKNSVWKYCVVKIMSKILKMKFKHLVWVELYLITPCWTSYFQFPQVIFLEEVKYLTTQLSVNCATGNNLNRRSTNFTIRKHWDRVFCHTLKPVSE